MNKKIQKKLYYIEKNLYEELNLIQLARVSNYSLFHFCRVFKLNVGETVMVYVNRLKLQDATIEIKLGKKSMVDIAFDAGYETQTGFWKEFKKHFGLSSVGFKQIMR